MKQRLLRFEFAVVLGALAGAFATALGFAARGEVPQPVAVGYLAALGAIWGASRVLAQGAEDGHLRSWALMLTLVMGGLPGFWIAGPAGAMLGALLILHAAACSGQVEVFFSLLAVGLLPVLGMTTLFVAFYGAPDGRMLLAALLAAGLHRVLFGTCPPTVCAAYAAGFTGNWMAFLFLGGLRLLSRLASW